MIEPADLPSDLPQPGDVAFAVDQDSHRVAFGCVRCHRAATVALDGVSVHHCPCGVRTTWTMTALIHAVPGFEGRAVGSLALDGANGTVDVRFEIVGLHPEDQE